jgi:serine/threonine-protein kinase RsbW
MIKENTKYNDNLCITGNFEELIKVRNFIQDNAKAFGFDEDIAYNISLAVDEACTNLILYAYNLDKSRKICIKLESDNDQYMISILDDGLPFNPLEMPSPEMNEYLKRFKRGGLGIHIMRSVMDKIEYYPASDNSSYNTLKLIKLLSYSN